MKKYFPIFASAMFITASLIVRVMYTRITDAHMPISDFDRNLYQGIQIWLVTPVGVVTGIALLFFPKQFDNWSISVIYRREKPASQGELFFLRMQGLFILIIISLLFWNSLQPFLALLL